MIINFSRLSCRARENVNAILTFPQFSGFSFAAFSRDGGNQIIYRFGSKSFFCHFLILKALTMFAKEKLPLSLCYQLTRVLTHTLIFVDEMKMS